MTRRTRCIAGLCALLALTFSFAESVWASTCAMPMAGGMAEIHETATEIPSGTHCAAHRGYETEHDAPGDRPCPFSSGVAAQACAGVVSLPASSAALPAVASEAVDAPFTLEERPDLLLEAFLFRPPRA